MPQTTSVGMKRNNPRKANKRLRKIVTNNHMNITVILIGEKIKMITMMIKKRKDFQVGRNLNRSSEAKYTER